MLIFYRMQQPSISPVHTSPFLPETFGAYGSSSGLTMHQITIEPCSIDATTVSIAAVLPEKPVPSDGKLCKADDSALHVPENIPCVPALIGCLVLMDLDLAVVIDP